MSVLAPGPVRRIVLALSLIVLLGVIAAMALAGRGDQGRPVVWRGEVGLFTSLPILWREAPDLTDLLESEAPPHWVQQAIAEHATLQGIDTLSPGGGDLPLSADAILIVAQPRPLSPDENVALDDWVRGGGRLLLFADPMLTSHSAFALGDSRRPQDVVLLSPILSRWGLQLRFDEDQPAGEREVELLGQAMPVNLPGSFALLAGAKDCSVEGNGIAARCRIGAGRVIAVADAAMLEEVPAGEVAARRTMLERLLEKLAEAD
ncbi:MAG: ABC transporter [Novosphingobium sp.]|nr:ABC transporter [Novosphingobium sp.]